MKKSIRPFAPSKTSTHRIDRFTPDHKPRPVVGTFQSQRDKRMALSKSYILQQECVKDLGVYVNRKFKWNTHTQCKVTNSRRAFYKLKNTIHWSTPSHIKYQLYVAYVVPLLLYGSQICCLSLADLKAFQNIQEKCLRWVYGNSRNYLDTLLTHKILPMVFRIQVVPSLGPKEAIEQLL